MKEIPILFSAPMVRAILAGQKTQTRRAVKPQLQGLPEKHERDFNPWGWFGEFVEVGGMTNHTHCFGTIKCHYGQPGDRLWVRETVGRRPASIFGAEATNGVEAAFYKADGEEVVDEAGFNLCPWWKGPVCVSIHMPRWASRISLEVTGIRVERLNDISEADAVAEGLESGPHGFKLYGKDLERLNQWAKNDPCFAYETLWESINGPGSWDKNPWVWVVEFKVLGKEGGRVE